MHEHHQTHTLIYIRLANKSHNLHYSLRCFYFHALLLHKHTPNIRIKSHTTTHSLIDRLYITLGLGMGREARNVAIFFFLL